MPNEDRLPWFPFYPRDFLSDSKVAAMPAAARGAYISLLCVSWDESPQGSLPNNDEMLRACSKMTVREWKKHRLTILAPFELRSDGRLYQKRLEKEAAKALAEHEKRRIASQKANEARWDPTRIRNGSATDPNQIRNGIRNGMSTDPNHNHNHNQKEGVGEYKAAPSPPPSGMIPKMPSDKSSPEYEAWHNEVFNAPPPPRTGKKLKVVI